MTQTEFHHAMPIYELLPGWDEDITGARSLEDLPKQARSYVEALEAMSGAPISVVGVGPDRERDHRRPVAGLMQVFVSDDCRSPTAARWSGGPSGSTRRTGGRRGGPVRRARRRRVWAAGYGGRSPRPQSAGAWRQAMERAAKDDRVMYVVRLIEPDQPRDGRIVGTTSLGDLDLANEKVHLGWTAYAPGRLGHVGQPGVQAAAARGTAFEHCGLGRVKLQTDSINARSQAAIAKLGATREGVARRHIKRADGTWRDSVVFSVIIDDWPRGEGGPRSAASPTCPTK